MKPEQTDEPTLASFWQELSLSVRRELVSEKKHIILQSLRKKHLHKKNCPCCAHRKLSYGSEAGFYQQFLDALEERPVKPSAEDNEGEKSDEAQAASDEDGDDVHTIFGDQLIVKDRVLMLKDEALLRNDFVSYFAQQKANCNDNPHYARCKRCNSYHIFELYYYTIIEERLQSIFQVKIKEQIAERYAALLLKEEEEAKRAKRKAKTKVRKQKVAACACDCHDKLVQPIANTAKRVADTQPQQQPQQSQQQGQGQQETKQQRKRKAKRSHESPSTQNEVTVREPIAQTKGEESVRGEKITKNAKKKRQQRQLEQQEEVPASSLSVERGECREESDVFNEHKSQSQPKGMLLVEQVQDEPMVSEEGWTIVSKRNRNTVTKRQHSATADSCSDCSSLSEAIQPIGMSTSPPKEKHRKRQDGQHVCLNVHHHHVTPTVEEEHVVPLDRAELEKATQTIIRAMQQIKEGSLSLPDVGWVKEKLREINTKSADTFCCSCDIVIQRPKQAKDNENEHLQQLQQPQQSQHALLPFSPFQTPKFYRPSMALYPPSKPTLLPYAMATFHGGDSYFTTTTTSEDEDMSAFNAFVRGTTHVNGYTL